MYKAMKDSLNNTISNTEDWPEFAKKDYNNRINRFTRFNRFITYRMAHKKAPVEAAAAAAVVEERKEVR
jgi:hypothetical protein